MTFQEALDHFHTKAEIARAAGVHRAVVQGWSDRKTVPLEQQIKLEVATSGKLRADVTAEFRRIVTAGAAAA